MTMPASSSRDPIPTTAAEPDFHSRQVGTTELSAVARLDRATEDRLYRLYRDFFTVAEDTRNWNLWEAVAWDTVRQTHPAELAAEALTAYREGIFVPDYSAAALKSLRSSRGRSWFLTRWGYEEAKHSMALNEWLVHAGVHTNDELKDMSDDMLAVYHWEPPYNDPVGIFMDSHQWETSEIARFTSLRARAEEAGESALVTLADLILKDEQAHEAFFRTALEIIAEQYPHAIEEGTRRLARPEPSA